MSEDVKVVSSILYTQADEAVNEKVAGDLKVPDPEKLQAQASIRDFTLPVTIGPSGDVHISPVLHADGSINYR